MGRNWELTTASHIVKRKLSTPYDCIEGEKKEASSKRRLLIILAIRKRKETIGKKLMKKVTRPEG